MEAKELRIGNYINKFGIDYLINTPIVDRYDIEIIIVDIDVLKNIEQYNYTTDYYYCEPIPLTEEWLLKFGYFPCDFRENHFWIQGHTVWMCNDFFTCEKNGIVLKYVHQLQNLYFALTGYELTIK